MRYLFLALLLAACSRPLPPLEVEITERPNTRITSGYVVTIQLKGNICRVGLWGQDNARAREAAIVDAVAWCESQR
jgi:hypothetical protein